MEYGTLVSIVMPVYNRAHLVPRVVAGLCAQNYPNLEIIIVDDCSSDDIEGAINALGDPRIRLIRRERNGGAAAARNTGIAAAQGDWIAFHDSDDYSTFDRIERSVRLLTTLSEDYIGVYGLLLIFDEVAEGDYASMRTYVRPFPHEWPLSGDLSERALRGNAFNLPTLLVRKSALIAAGGFDETLRANEDWDLCLRLTRQGRFGFLTELLTLTPTSHNPQVSALRVSRSQRQSARSFVRITGKLRHAHVRGPVLANHYMTTARYLLLVGRPRFARRFMHAALVNKPLAPKIWAHYLISLIPGLHARLRRRTSL